MLTVPLAFQTFKSNLEITGLQRSTVSSRQQNVRNAIGKELVVIETFLTGSYSRRTLISPLDEADIDIFLVLDPSYFHHYNGQNGGPAGLLDLVKRTIIKTYPRTPDISRNGQAISIQFSDFIVDVVPAFNRDGGGYLIPNSITQTWLSTDPKRHSEIWVNHNSNHNGDLIPLIKMLKAWNRSINSYFRSFHIEVLALQILTRVQISDFHSGVRYFFDKGRTYITKKNWDPAGYGDDVGAYLSTQPKVHNAVTRFNTAYSRALKSEELVNQGYISDSLKQLRSIFGNYFPISG